MKNAFFIRGDGFVKNCFAENYYEKLLLAS